MAFQNPSRFITANAGPTPSSDRENEGDKHVSQDLTLQLLQCCDVESLGSAVRDGISSYIPEAYGGALFYVDETTGDVITADNAGLTVCSPDPDCIKQAYGEKQEVILSVQSIPQCVLEQLRSTDSRSFTNQTQVLCSPVFKGQNGSVSAVLVIALDDITSKVAEKLSWLKKQIAACYSHIQRTFQGRAAEERASQQLIKLCGELYDQDASKLQLKVLKYLEDQTQAECAFLLLVVPETQELFCQESVIESEFNKLHPSITKDVKLKVIGKRILEEEIRFPGQSSSFSVALETKQPINLDDIPVENRKCIEEVIEIPLRSFLCVPVTSRNDDNLIALACLVNKQNGNRFTDRDVTCIRQCFRYTATVLTSTLAFQNERKIKIQTQALLQVARHLFTNLGELMIHKPPGLDNFPYIRSRHWEVNVMGTTFLDAISTNRFSKKPFRNIREIVNLSPRPCVGQACIHSLSDISKTLEVQCGSMADRFCRCMQRCNCKPCECKVSLENTCHVNDAMCCSTGSTLTVAQILVKDVHVDSPTIVKDITALSIPGEEDPAAQKTILNRDTSLASVGPDDMDKESDYASAYASGSDNVHTSQGTSEEIDSSFSYQTATDSESTCMDSVGGNHKKAHHRINSTSPSKQRSFDKCRKGMEDSISDVALSFQDGRLSNSEPCIPAKHSALNVSKTDVDKAITNDSHECVDDKVITTGENSGSVLAESIGASESESGHDGHGQVSSGQVSSIFQITLDKVDISDIQASPTDLVAITENDLTKLLREVMAQARNLTQAERCSVFLIDDETDELVAKVFDGITKTKDNEVQEEIRMPSTQGIAGHVATSGELLNIKDAYSHPLFYRGIDDSTGFRTRNILCFPIKNEEGKIMGVAQLCNKKTGPFFTQFDEDLATAFGIYCCISISHSLLYKKVIDSQVRNSLANELMMYHMKSIMYNRLQDSQHRKSLANELMIYHMQVSPEDVTGLTSVEIPHPRFLDPDFVEFRYAPRSLPDSKTLLACLSMFEDLNLISRWRIKRDCLARFILMVKKGYRNPPYHNWTHAYTVAQFCYQLAKNMKLEENYLDGIEIYALFVSCLCHDIDHRGTNNSFQTASKSVLAALYSSEGSVLERHHFAQTMCILNTEGCNIFEHLTSKEYQQMLDLIRDIILATDLAHHLKILKNIREMSVRGYDRKSVKDHKLLLCLLMTSCDLSDQTKPWDNTKNVAALIYKEFFTQGDMEKASGFQPAEMMDRERAQIPEVQIGFLDHIALPVYKVLSDIFPEGKEVSQAVENNKKHWEKIRNFIKLKRGGSCARMTFDEVIAIESEADDEVMEDSSEQLNHSVSNGSG